MLRRLNADGAAGAHSAPRAPEANQTHSVVAAAPDVDLDTSLLPRDHPQWVKDSLTVSNRARELLARLKPVVIKILTFWDHRVRSAIVGTSRISIDPSGSYRNE